jgi:hypothetical protein
MGQRTAAVSAEEKQKRKRSQSMVRVGIAIVAIALIFASQFNAQPSVDPRLANGARTPNPTTTTSATASKVGRDDVVMNVVLDDETGLPIEGVELPVWPPIPTDGYPQVKPGYTIAAPVQRVRLNDGQEVPCK